MEATIFLGAGFSRIAGLPLTSELFKSSIDAPSPSSLDRIKKVLRTWEKWHEKNPEENAEQFIGHIFNLSKSSSSPIPWKWVVEVIAASIATPRGPDAGSYNHRYAGRITSPLKCREHQLFWKIVNRIHIRGVISTNYDLVIERGLRHREITRNRMPGIFYGGLDKPQLLKGTALPFSIQKQNRLVELTGKVPLFKLHGSLNWSFESGNLIMYQDMRAAFRRGNDAAIIPPLPEKSIPLWLKRTWAEAQEALSSSGIWIICGYSLPDYDIAVRDLLEKASDKNYPKEILIIDPNAKNIEKELTLICPLAEITCLPGLPDCLDPLTKHIETKFL